MLRISPTVLAARELCELRLTEWRAARDVYTIAQVQADELPDRADLRQRAVNAKAAYLRSTEIAEAALSTVRDLEGAAPRPLTSRAAGGFAVNSVRV